MYDGAAAAAAARFGAWICMRKRQGEPFLHLESSVY